MENSKEVPIGGRQVCHSLVPGCNPSGIASPATATQLVCSVFAFQFSLLQETWDHHFFWFQN